MSQQNFEFRQTLKRGSTGPAVKLVQEMLCHWGHGVKIDSDFGPATERAVRDFQTNSGWLPKSGVVREETHNELVKPIFEVTSPLPYKGTYNDLILVVLRRHLSARPEEIGGQNMGPWVRLYTGGYEGKDYPWCAGFATFVAGQAAVAARIPAPYPATLSCDALAAFGVAQKRFLAEGSDRKKLVPGSLFLVRSAPNDWTHTGVVTEVKKDHFVAVEGNTNDAGGREGYKVAERVRGYSKIDFVLPT